MWSYEQEDKYGSKILVRLTEKSCTLRKRERGQCGREIMLGFRSVMFKVTAEYSVEMSSSVWRKKNWNNYIYNYMYIYNYIYINNLHIRS